MNAERARARAKTEPISIDVNTARTVFSIIFIFESFLFELNASYGYAHTCAISV